jgi:hypothetical protein
MGVLYRAVPTISQFYGIKDSHVLRRSRAAAFPGGVPGGDAMIDIERLVVLEGSLPNRALWLVLDWAKLPQSELRANWMRTQELAPLETIDPLE